MSATGAEEKNSPSRTARLAELLEGAGIDAGGVDPAVEIGAIEYDSRQAEPGSLFVAIRGFVNDGHEHVAGAAANGAVAALVERPTGTPGIVEVVVPSTRTALGLAAHEFYGRPSERLTVYGITGTNGKTTTSYLLDSILRAAGSKTGVIGTLGYRIDERVVSGDRTSPESLDLAMLLASLVESGAEAVVLEVSSHALSLDRIAGLRLDTAIFTNLSRDHLDFHGSIEEYGNAKKKLFELLGDSAWKPGATAIVNCEDAFGADLVSSLAGSRRVRTVTYGMRDGDVRASGVATTPCGTDALFHTPAGDFPVRLRLVADFNVMNALAATAAAVARGIDTEAIRDGLEATTTVPGRLEVVDEGQDFVVIVDYAHTPDALEKLLTAVRRLGVRRTLTVFGCGGDRDRGKRPLMGEAVARLSDVVIVTSDNPRTEDPAAIIDDILAGVREVPNPSGARAVEVIEDRGRAIARAVELARPRDVIVIAGKGHEDYQIVGTTRAPFDDRAEARRAIERLSPRR